MRFQEALRILVAAVAGAVVVAIMFLIVGSILLALAVTVPILLVLAVAAALLSGRGRAEIRRE
ncbi:hypothetical protein [Arenibaculum sp.]|jgi:hypothetical protein|uniref:hypothetical protein n=1 Tax=Arenibaculum sp. TaxID=2865862 RepID=UPI002E143A23|nr:hypothetical protein [Arenibaculum sp.]